MFKLCSTSPQCMDILFSCKTATDLHNIIHSANRSNLLKWTTLKGHVLLKNITNLIIILSHTPWWFLKKVRERKKEEEGKSEKSWSVFQVHPEPVQKNKTHRVSLQNVWWLAAGSFFQVVQGAAVFSGKALMNPLYASCLAPNCRQAQLETGDAVVDELAETKNRAKRVWILT